MRKILELISLAILAALFVVGGFEVFGPNRLPARIPTHFDTSGNANGWSSPSALLLLPLIALGVYVAMTVVSRFPETFNYPVTVTAENRPRLEALALDLLAWMKAEVAILAVAVMWIWLGAIQHPGQAHSPLWVLVFVGAILATAAWFIGATVRQAR